MCQTTRLEIQQLPLAQFKPDAGNARTHSESQILQIAESLRAFGFVNPILVGEDGSIIAGHARYLAALRLNLTEVPAIVLRDLTPAQRRALAIADNQLALNAGWDEQKLRAELQALEQESFDIHLTGFNERELKRLLAAPADAITLDPEAAPRPPAVPISRPGDCWILGEHRLYCGDATSQAVLDFAREGGRADMVFTAFSPANQAFRALNPDASDAEQYEALRPVCRSLIEATQGSLYLCLASSALIPAAVRAFRDGGWALVQLHRLGSTPSARGPDGYPQQYLPILYGWPNGRPPDWRKSRHQTDVWSIPQSTLGVRPAEVVERALANSSKKGNLVLDPFAGSGWTLMACERRHRKARLAESDPRLVDSICLRWQQFTGKAAILEGTHVNYADLTRSERKAA